MEPVWNYDHLVRKEGAGSFALRYLQSVNVSITKTRLFKCIATITTKNYENFEMKNSSSFQISVQNIDCGLALEPPRRGGSNEYPQFMFLSRNKNSNVYPCKPQFYCIKVGLWGSKLYRRDFVMS